MVETLLRMTDFKNKNIRIQSSRLYGNSNFIIGMGSIFNIAGKYFDYNYSESDIEADNLAIKRDWEIVGKELSNSIPVLEDE